MFICELIILGAEREMCRVVRCRVKFKLSDPSYIAKARVRYIGLRPFLPGSQSSIPWIFFAEGAFVEILVLPVLSVGDMLGLTLLGTCGHVM